MRFSVFWPGRARLLVVDEEERLVAAVPHARDHDRPADTAARLMQDVFGLRRGAVAVVEPGVGVEVVVLQVVVAAAREAVAARARDEADLHRALTGAGRVLRRRADGDFFHRVEPRADAREEAVAGLQVVVLRADAVDRDVDRALRQAVDRRVARCRPPGVFTPGSSARTRARCGCRSAA